MDKLLVNSIYNNVFSKNTIAKHFNFTYYTQKFNLKQILYEIIKVIKYALPWRSINIINWSTVYKINAFLCKHNIFKNTYIDMLNKYIKKDKNKKLRYIYTDSTAILNRYGQEGVTYNGYKRRKITKLSIITDSYGMPLNIYLAKRGSQHDSKLLVDQLDKNIFLINERLIKKNSKYFLADSAYDTLAIRKKIKDIGIDKAIIYINKRNKKGTVPFTYKENKIYKKRIKIEHLFRVLKLNRRIMNRYERSLKSFENVIYFACLKLLMSKI